MLLKVSHSNNKLLLHFNIIYPSYTFSYTQIKQLYLYDCPLSTMLLKDSVFSNRSEELYNGYLTMDSSRQIVPLKFDSPTTFDHPLIGIWIAVTDSSILTNLSHPFIGSMCMKYLQDTKIKVFYYYIVFFFLLNCCCYYY